MGTGGEQEIWYSRESIIVKVEVEVVEISALAAVHFVDSLTNPCLLVEHGTVETQKFYICHVTLLPNRAYVEHLTSRLDVGIVTTDDFTFARKIRLGKVVKIQVLKQKLFFV